MLMLRGHFSLTRLTIRENLTLVAFSFLFTVNIAISNVTLYGQILLLCLEFELTYGAEAWYPFHFTK